MKRPVDESRRDVLFYLGDFYFIFSFKTLDLESTPGVRLPFEVNYENCRS